MEDTFDEAYRAHGAAIFAYLVRMTGDRPLAEELTQVDITTGPPLTKPV